MLVGSGRMLARLVRVVTAYARHAVPERWCVVGDVLAQASCVCVCVGVASGGGRAMDHTRNGAMRKSNSRRSGGGGGGVGGGAQAQH